MSDVWGMLRARGWRCDHSDGDLNKPYWEHQERSGLCRWTLDAALGEELSRAELAIANWKASAEHRSEELAGFREELAETRKALELEQKAHALTVSAASAAFESVKARLAKSEAREQSASLLLDKCGCPALSTQIQLWQLETT